MAIIKCGPVQLSDSQFVPSLYLLIIGFIRDLHDLVTMYLQNNRVSHGVPPVPL